jgi:hypothetical protein
MWMLWKHANQSIGATISLVGHESFSPHHGAGRRLDYELRRERAIAAAESVPVIRRASMT